MEEKYGFVYIWRDKSKNRYYIGSHWGREDDYYICSSMWMRNSYKRRPQDFRRKILKKIYTNREDLLQEEHKWLSLIPEEKLGNIYYNLHRRHPGHWASDEYKLKKMVEFCKKRTHTEETKKKISESKKGQHPKTEFRKNSIPWNKGVPCLEEVKQKIGKANKGKSHPAWNKDLPAWNKGKFWSEETKEKQRQAHLGKCCPEETKKKLSELNKGKPWSEKRRLAEIKRKDIK